MAWRPIIGGGIQIPVGGSGGSQSLAQTLAIGNDANALNIKNLADPVDTQDALTLNYWNNNLVPEATYAVTASNNANGFAIVGDDTGNLRFISTAGDYIFYDNSAPGNCLQATNAFNDQFGNNISNFYLNNESELGSCTILGNIVNTLFSNSGQANQAINDENGLNIASNYALLSAFSSIAFDQNLTSNGSGEFGANAITLNNGPLAFGADTSGNLIIDGFLGGVGNDGIFFSTGAVGISGTFTMGLGVTTNGTITLNGGLVTAVQEAS